MRLVQAAWRSPIARVAFRATRGAAMLAAASLALLSPGGGSAEDAGHVAILRHDGSSYARTVGGVFNVAPRQATAKKFFQTHSDSYDFLVVFPAFPVDFGNEVQGLHVLVRNAVSGIGLPITDGGALYGSTRRLQGYVDMASLAPGSPFAALDPALVVLAHEVAHQWSGQVRFRNASGQTSPDLLGADAAHWSFFLDSDASVLYGSRWAARAAGAFEALESRKRYSALDLYLMGFLAPGEVSPFTLLRPAPGGAHIATDLPPLDHTSISATPESISLEQVIAVEGARVPAAGQSPRAFRAAFAVLVGPGQEPSQAQLDLVDSVRREWANRFFFMTRGRAVMETDLVEVPPEPVATSPSVDLGLQYLLARQGADGSWSDTPATPVRDTQAALEALGLFSTRPGVPAAAARGGAFLAAAAATNLDSASRRVLGLLAARQPAETAAAALESLAARATKGWNGGLGPSRGYAPTPLDSALAAGALLGAGRGPGTLADLTGYLTRNQAADGAWPLTEAGPGRIEPTARALGVLRLLPPSDAVLAAAAAGLQALAARQQPDGAFQDDRRSAATTAFAVLTLADWSQLTAAQAAQGTSALLVSQRPEGSWSGSAYQTAMALRALRIGLTPNLAVRDADVHVSAASVTEGEPVSVTAVVRNAGYGNAGAFSVQAFDSNGLPLGPPVSVASLAAGAAATVTLNLDTTGHAGSTQVFVVADPEGVVDELREDDNRAGAALAVQAPPLLPDLYVLKGSLQAVPGVIDHLPQGLTVTAVVGNSGRTPASGVHVGLWAGGAQVASATLDFPARSSQAVSFPATVAAAAGSSVAIAVVVDYDAQVAEAREDDNLATATVPVVATVDLAVLEATAWPDPVEQGGDATIDYALSSSGTIEATATVEFLIRDAGGSIVAVLPPQAVAVAAGSSAARRTVWRANVAGDLVVEVRAVHGQERNPADNVARAPLRVNPSVLPNLAVRPGDLTVSPIPPLQASPATASVTVRNTGGGAAGTFTVEFHLGDPSKGAPAFGRREVPGLGPGESVSLTASFSPSAAERTQLVVLVDPENRVVEVDEADNVATLGIDPLPIPDLVVTELDIRPGTVFPREGVSLPVTVSVYNAGGQDATTVPVGLYLGDPDDRGVPLGSVVLGVVKAGARGEAAFSFSTAGLVGPQRLVALVNQDGRIAEKSYLNNRADRQIVVQDGAIALSNPFFSPNGDGVKDDTEVFFRVGAAQPVELRVSDAKGAVVRTLEGAPGVASAIWDGRRDDGSVAWDGNYEIRVLAGGTAVGTVRAVVDTNRSQVSEAAGTPLLEMQADWRPNSVRKGDFQFTARYPVYMLPDDSGFLSVGYLSDVLGTLLEGVYLWPMDGDEPELVTPPGWNGTGYGSDALFLAPDGDRVAYVAADSLGVNRDVFVYSLSRQTVDAHYPMGYRYVTLFGFTPDGRYLLANVNCCGLPDQLTLFDTVGHEERVLDVDVQQSLADVRASPDGTKLSYLSDGALWVVNVDGTGRRLVLPKGRIGSYDLYGGYLMRLQGWERTHQWLDDERIAFLEGGTVREVWDRTSCALAAAARQTLRSTPCYLPEGTGITSIDVATGRETALFRADPGSELNFGPRDGGELALGPHRDALIFPHTPGQQAAESLWMLSPASGESQVLWDQPFLVEAPYYRPDQIEWSPQGTLLFNRGGQWFLRTLANMRVQLSASRPLDSASLVIQGTASDLNFEEYELTAKPVGAPGPGTVFARSRTPVAAGELARWTPPGQGSYEVALTARDKAGNARTRSVVVGWSEAPALSGLSREPEYISPNGDGIQDTARVSYAVSAPLTTEFSLMDSARAAVRRFQRTHLSPGSFFFDWDGRSDAGNVVPDGRYLLVSEGGELGFTVDTVAPAPWLHLEDEPFCGIGYADLADGPWGVEVAEYAVRMEAGADDLNPAECALEQSASSSGPFEWRSTCHKGSPSLRTLRGVTLRTRARDRAGNEAVGVPRGLATEKLFVTAVGDATAFDPRNGHLLVPGGGSEPRRDLLPFRCSRGGPPTFPFKPGEYAIALDTSIAEPLMSYAIAYRPRPGVAQTPEPWIVDAVNVRPVTELALLWDASALSAGEYDFEVRAIDALGRLFAAPFYGSDTSAGVGFSACVSGGTTETTKVSVLFEGRSLEQVPPSGTLEFISAAAPSAPELTHEATAVWTPFGATYQATVDTSALASCVYVVKLVATSSTGTSAEASSTFNLCGVQILDVQRAGDEAVVVLGETFRQELKSVDLFLGNSLGYRLVATAGGFSGSSPPIRFGVARQECGPGEKLRLVARLADGSSFDSLGGSNGCDPNGLVANGLPCPLGGEMVATLTGKRSIQAPSCSKYFPVYQLEAAAQASTNWTVSQLLASTQPISGGSSTALPLASFAPAARVTTSGALDMQAVGPGAQVVTLLARDSGGASAVATWQVPAVDLTAPSASATVPGYVCATQVRMPDGSARSRFTVQGRVADDHLVAYSVQMKPTGGVFSERDRAGYLGSLPGLVDGTLGTIYCDATTSGDYELRVEAFDTDGSSCSNPVGFHLNCGAHAGTAAVVPEVFSPDGDGNLDTATLSLQLSEPAQVVVRATSEGGLDGVAYEGPLGVGPNQVVLDGWYRDGRRMADGLNLLRIEALDPCGSATSAEASVTLDTQAPVARIDAPAAGSAAGAVLQLVGEASDATFESYEIGLGVGGAPAQYTTISTSAEPAIGPLGAIATASLVPGEYTARLLVRDRVGHTSSASLPFQVQGQGLIETFAVSPTAVSPNGDGVLDASAATLSLKAPALALVEILDAQGSTRAIALPPTPLPGGPTLVPLDGAVLAGVLDGAYVVQLTAMANGVTETATAGLLVDRVPPELAVAAPAAGAFVPGRVEVIGSAADPLLTRWRLESGVAGGPLREVSGGRTSASGILAALGALGDGPREIALSAEDAAGNAREIRVSFASDATPPKVGFLAPLDGALVSSRGGPIEVRGFAGDANLASWSLALVRGGTSRDLATGVSPPTGGLLALWDASAEPDGPAELVLRAGDRAGNSAEVRSAVVLDSTPPTARITSPRNAFLGAPARFEGTVGDANLESYKLEIADGAPGTAFRFASIATGTSPVSGLLAELATVPADGTYTARLTALDRAGNRSVDEAAFVVDTTPPRAPPVLAAVASPPNEVMLTWTASPDSDVVGYRVLRASAGGALAPLGQAPLSGLSYPDRGVPDGTWRYAVVAVDAAGLESPHSPEASASIDTTPPLVRIAHPINGAAVAGLVSVTGTAYSSDDFREYRLSIGEGASPSAYAPLARATLPVASGILGQFDAGALLQGSIQTLRLEAEDRAGNVGVARVTVQIDNLPPLAPVLLSASAQGSRVTVTWAPNVEADLAGYLVYRNGALANAPDGVSSPDYAPFLLGPGVTTFADRDRPDGTYRYQVQAVDTAGNVSGLSNALSVSIDLHPPSAAIVVPAHLERIAGPVVVVADAADIDIASVQLEVRAGNDPGFSPLGPALTRRPFVARLDPAAFPSPVLELRAVAKDVAGKIDPTPRSVFTFHDPALEQPALSALVDGGAVTLTIASANAADRVAGYQAQRDSTRVGPSPAPVTGTASATSSAPGSSPQAAYDGNYGTTWDAGSGFPQTWELAFASPAVVSKINATLYGYQLVESDVQLRVKATWVTIGHVSTTYGGGIIVDVPSIETDGLRLVFTGAATGPPRLSEVGIVRVPVVASPLSDGPLAVGTYQYVAAVLSPFGQAVTGSASALVYQPTLDALPATVGAPILTLRGKGAMAGDTVHIYRNGVGLADAAAGADGTFQQSVALVLDQNGFYVQAADAAGNRSIPSPQASVLYDAPPEADVLLSLAGVSSGDVSLAFAVSGDTARLSALQLRRSTGDSTATIATLGPAARSYVDPARPNGTYRYVVVPVNAHGFGGKPSNEVTASVDVAVPPAPHDLAVDAPPDGTLVLSWAYAGPPGRGFLVERAESGAGPFEPLNAGQLAQTAQFRDASVRVGTRYFYRARALDSRGNAGGPSEVASGTPYDPTPPPAPVLTAPTVAGRPVTLLEHVTDVSGMAPGATTVELFRNQTSMGAATVAALGVRHAPFATAFTSNDEIAFAPDGQKLAYTYIPPGGYFARLAVEDVGAHSAVTFGIAGIQLWNRPHFSPDGRMVAIAGYPWDGGNERIYVADLAAGTLRPLLAGDLGGETGPSWSPDSTRVAYTAFRDPSGAYGLAWAGVSDGVEHGVALLPEADLTSAVWPEDPSILAVVSPWDAQLDDTVSRFDLAAGTRADLYSAPGVEGPLEMAPGRDQLAFVAVGVAGRRDLQLLSLATGSTTQLTGDAASERSPVFSPDGSQVAYFSGADIVLRDLAGASVTTSGSVGYAGQLAWSSTGTVLARSFARKVERITWGGDFTFPGVELVGGENLFLAVGRDGTGNPSAPSAPIQVFWEDGGLADLAVEVALQPAVPIAGTPATAIVTLRNLGAAAANSPEVSVTVAGSDGSIRPARSVTLPGSLAPGGSEIVAVPLDLLGLVGGQTLWVVADPSGAIPDADRANNTAEVPFDVATDAGLTLVVRVDPASVQANGSVTADVRVVNPGLPRDVAVRVLLEDAGGGRILQAGADEVFAPMAGGASVSFTRSFGVANAVAGEYRVVAEAYAGGTELSRGSAPLTVEPDRDALLALASSRAAYRTGEEIALQGTVTNRSTNAFLSGAEYRLEIRDASGVAVFQSSAALPALAPGGSTSLAAAVPPPGLSPGSYAATARVVLAGGELATATASFSVTGWPLLVGSLEVRGSTAAPPAVPAGSDAAIAYALVNAGGAPSQVAALRVAVVDPDSGAVLSAVDAPAGALAVGASLSGTLAVPTAGLAYKTYAVSLVCEHDGLPAEILATARFRVGDARPPVLALVNLAPGMFVQGAVAPRVRATDDVSGVAAVRVAVDGLPEVALALASGDPLDGVWSGALALGGDGVHTLVFGAVDRDGNDGAFAPSASNPIAVAVISDSTPPLVSIRGVVEGSLSAAPVVPVVEASDANLAVVQVFLNGIAFASGTPVGADGDYLLVAQATDRAANASSASVRFSVDRTPPAIAISGIADGAIVSRTVTPVVRVSDRHPGSYSVTLNGLPFVEGTTLAADGAYLLSVQAVDVAGNPATGSVGFAIDRTPPAVTIGGFVDASYVSGTVLPTYAVSDANLLSVEATLNGRPFASGTSVTAEGNYVLAVVALDKAGNRTERTGAFVIDRTPPAVALSGFVDGSFVNASVSPAYAADDAHLASVEATLDGIPFVAGMMATSEAFHVFRVVALDLAGNRTEKTGTFTIDRTPPLVTLGGFVDGSVLSVAAVTPSYQATDADLATVQATLDGQPFTGGTPVSAEGWHALAVSATDKAGNRADRSGSFTIDRTPPRISIAGVSNGQVSRVALSPTVSFSDANLASTSVALDGQPFLSGSPVTGEGDHVLAADAADKAGNRATVTVRFAIDVTPPLIAISGVVDGGTYTSPVTPVVTVTDTHLAGQSITLDGASFVSGTTVSADGLHLLAVHSTDAGGNVADRAVHFTLATASSGVHQQPGGRFARVLALVRAGCCAVPTVDLTRIGTFLGTALGGADRILYVTGDETEYLRRLRSGLYNVFVVVAVPQRLGVLDDGCGEDREDVDDLPTDPPSVRTRKAIAREITELVLSGHAGVVGVRNRPELVPKYRAVLGVDPGGFVLATTVKLTAAPFTPSANLTLARRGVRLRLVGASEAGVYQPPPLLGSDSAATFHPYGLGNAVALGFDPSVASAAADAVQAIRRAVDSVTPQDSSAPLAVTGVEIALDAGSGNLAVLERVPPPLSVAGAAPAGTVGASGDTVSWQVHLSPAAQTVLRLFARLPDAVGTFPVVTELPPATDPASTLDLANAETGSDLLADARLAAAALPTSIGGTLVRQVVIGALGTVEGRPIRSRADIEANLADLFRAVAAVRVLNTPEALATRLELDDLIRYWEARWYVY